MTPEDVEARLARLARQTSAISARAGFSRGVVARVGAQAARSFEQQLARSARPVVVAAALLALAVLALSLSSQQSLDRSLATEVGAPGAEW
ncbi:MAG TPA: hypothetical protein VFQ35_04350 [Polyangiaceae bacterium]|nr:hypothetical protein [Polyangiaceae bacterium]